MILFTQHSLSFIERQFTCHTIHHFKVYNSMMCVFRVVQLSPHSLQSNFFASKKKISYRLAIANYSRTLTPPSPSQPLIYFLSLQICLFCTLNINGIIQYVVLCGWLLSFSIFSRLIHVVACASISLLLIAEQYFIV